MLEIKVCPVGGVSPVLPCIQIRSRDSYGHLITAEGWGSNERRRKRRLPSIICFSIPTSPSFLTLEQLSLFSQKMTKKYSVQDEFWGPGSVWVAV